MKKTVQEQGIRENIHAQLKSLEDDRKKIRFQHSLGKFISGEYSSLKNDEFIQGLSVSFRKENFPEIDTLNATLEALSGAILTSDTSVRKRVLPILYQAANFFLSLGHREGILCVNSIMLEWLRSENETLPGAESINKKIEECLTWMFKHEIFEEIEYPFHILHEISIGDIYSNPAMKAMVGKCLKNLAVVGNLKKITEGYFKDKEKRELYHNILVSLSPDSVFYILDLAVQSDKKGERIALIKLIGSFGNAAVESLASCLESRPSWAVVRNIIYIIGEIGDPANYHIIEKFHGYPDERVQLESIGTTIKLGGEEKRKRLIGALLQVNERLKLHILRLLLEEGTDDELLYEALVKLVGLRATFSYSAGTELLSSIITYLKMFPTPDTVKLLLEMRRDYEKGADVGQVVLLIDEALSSVEPQIRHGSQVIKGSDDNVVIFDNDPEQQQYILEMLQGIEDAVQKHLRVGDKKAASAYIYEQAISATHQGNFSVAEKLKDRLLEVNPLALSEVVKIGEVIDGQRTVAITPHHIEIWQELYERMTTKQFNALYYNSFQESYRRGDIIVRSGETDNCLYFLNSGTISLTCDSGKNEIFLRKMNPGDILGAEQFFAASVWTITLTALSSVQLHVLDQEGWQKVLAEAPELEEKLEIFCQRYEKIADLVRMTGDDRRLESRHQLHLKTRHILLDPFGQKSKRSFRGELIDLSRSGIAFTIKLANQKTAKTLLGRQILSYLDMDGAVYPEFAGLVVGVRMFDAFSQKYSVHVKLAKIIGEPQFKSIIKPMR